MRWRVHRRVARELGISELGAVLPDILDRHPPLKRGFFHALAPILGVVMQCGGGECRRIGLGILSHIALDELESCARKVARVILGWGR